MGLLIARTGDHDKIRFEKTGLVYAGTMYVLLGLIILSVLGLPLLLTGYFVPVASQTLGMPVAVVMDGWNMHIGAMKLPMVPLLIALFLLPVTIITALFIRFKNVDRVKEYMCGEKINYSFSSFYFSTDRATPYFTTTGILFFVALIVAALI